MLKLLRKARNVSSWRAIPVFKNVRKFYFAYNVFIATAEDRFCIFKQGEKYKSEQIY